MKKILLISILTLLLIANVSAEGRTGLQIFNATCTTCHTPGLANAPKAHDEEAWKARNKTTDELVASAKKGLNVMPPMGMCADCTDAELKAAIEYMKKKAE